MHSQQLTATEQMMDISLGVYTVDITVAVGVERLETVGPFGVAHIDDASAAEQHSAAPVAGWHNAVEHIDPTGNSFENVGGCAYAHEVTGTVGGQNFVHHLNHLIHFLSRLTYGEATDGVTVSAKVSDLEGCFVSEVRESASLHYREESLGVAVERLSVIETCPASTEPGHCEVERLAGIRPLRLPGGALVERHHDVGTDGTLDVNCFFGGEKVFGAVDMAPEPAAFWG